MATQLRTILIAQTTQRRARAILTIVGTVAVLWTVGCNGPAKRGTSRSRPNTALVADVNELSIVPGRPFVLPVRAARPDVIASGTAWRPAGTPAVRTILGNPVSTQLYWFAAGRPEATPDHWLPPVQRWSVEPWEEIQAASTPGPSGSGFWGLLIDLGPGSAARTLSLDGLPVPIRWIDPPVSITDVARSPRLDASGDATVQLGVRLAAEASDPMRRWRSMLIADRIRADSMWPNGPPSPQPHPALEALARQLEDRWRSALEIASTLDPVLGADLLNTLTSVVMTPDGELLPAWPLDDAETSRLQQSMLTRNSRPSVKKRALEAWLAQHPASMAWVIDDAGPESAGAAGRSVSVAISELRGRETVVSLAPSGQAAQNPTRLRGHASVALTVETGLVSDGSPAEVVARAAGHVFTLGAMGNSIGVTPPGWLIGPLAPQASMMSWRANVSKTAIRASATVALLSHDPNAGWRLYLECNTIDPPLDGDSVRIWFGPRPSREPVAIGPGDNNPNVEVHPDHWSAMVPIPAQAIEASGTLRLGLERVIPGSGRWSWPRPMIPGQLEPGRALFNLRNWGSLAKQEVLPDAKD